MSDRLQKARQALHNSMRGQAAERAVRTLGGHIPAPHLPAGTYTGAYAAQGLRTTNPAAAAQLWESRHPAQMRAGNVPGWVTNAEMGQLPHPGHSFPSSLNTFSGHGFPQQLGNLGGDVVGSNPFTGAAHRAPPPAMGGVPHGFGPGGLVNGLAPQPEHTPSFNPQELIHLGGGIYLHHPTGTIFGGGGLGAVGGGAMNAITNALHSVSGPAASQPVVGPARAV